jgi:ataxia telangiectasia mutated family protein
LNNRKVVEEFAHNSWSTLVELWGSKDRGLRESLVCVLRVLFPNYTVAAPGDFAWAEGVHKLWHRIQDFVDSRWSTETISLDKLRLEIASEDDMKQPFVFGTFRAGEGFDSSHALSWAVLELQADCAEKVRHCA